MNKIEQISQLISKSDAILIGAGAGLSTAAGFTYTGARFEKSFSDFIAKYHFTDMYSGGFYPFETLEEHWAYWSRYINVNRYECDAGKVYVDLLKLVEGKEYFVLTTNVDHQFQKAGFDKKRLFYTQGDYGLFQCSIPCHQGTYDNEEQIRAMIAEQKDMRIPTALIPHCPKCGKPMSMNLRSDDTFVEDAGWNKASLNFDNFVTKHYKQNLLLLELGVGYNTPSIIKYPFWNMAIRYPHTTYVCITKGMFDLKEKQEQLPEELRDKAICIDGDCALVISELLTMNKK
jgi:NAD-dependent SIR2 family protein deacetylase